MHDQRIADLAQFPGREHVRHWDETLGAFKEAAEQAASKARNDQDGADHASGFDPNSVRKVVTVMAPREVARRVFTEQMESWWPLAMYKIGKANAVDAVIEPRVGGAGMNAAMMEAAAIGAVASVLMRLPGG